jgi:small subunit ribosomal protein S12e
MASSSASGLVSVSVPGNSLAGNGLLTGYVTGVLDREGNARKVVNCSCVVVKDWGEESQERSILLNYFQSEA